MAKKKETYSQAMARLETIVRQVDSNELEIDELVEKIKEANEIIAFCSEKLKKADTEIEKLLADKQENEEYSVHLPKIMIIITKNIHL